MPTLARLPRCKLTMYAGDHNPPHFHILAADGSQAGVELGSLRVLFGQVPPPVLSDALDWARAHPALLAAKWKELNP